jgi:hypothetical protein
MFCAPRLHFDGTECVGSRFFVLRARNSFQRYRGCQVPFSYFARPDSFPAVPRAPVPVFMFCAPGLVFDCTEGVGSSPVFIFCAPGLVSGGTEGIGSCFHILRSRTHFRRSHGRRVPFSCFALPDLFSGVRRASVLVFKFCPVGLVFGVTEGVGSRFHIFLSRTCSRLYQGCQVPFSFFACPYSFSAVPRASVLVFMFCDLGLFWAVPRASGPVFIICAPRREETMLRLLSDW